MKGLNIELFEGLLLSRDEGNTKKNRVGGYIFILHGQAMQLSP